MTKYRLAALVKEENLTAVIAAMMAAGMNQHLGTEILITEAVKERDPETIADIARDLPMAPSAPSAPATARPPKLRAKRGNGGEWPPDGSIYSIVLKALDGGAMTPSELRDVLKEGGFSPGSLGSALGRLEKQKKALRLDDGRWGPA
jgi:hypothetical protein